MTIGSVRIMKARCRKPGVMEVGRNEAGSLATLLANEAPCTSGTRNRDDLGEID